MESGPSPAPLGVGGSGHGGVPPLGHTPNSTTPPVPHTTYDCSENGSIDSIKKLITNAASKYPHDNPLHSKLDMKTSAPEQTINQYSLQQPSWSTIGAGGVTGYPRLPRQSSTLEAATARIASALKSPPQHYQRELIPHCDRGAKAFECPVSRLVEDLKRASKQGEAVGELQTLQKLQSGDMILRFDTTESRDSWRRCEKDWMKVFGVGAHLKERHNTVSRTHHGERSGKG